MGEATATAGPAIGPHLEGQSPMAQLSISESVYIRNSSPRRSSRCYNRIKGKRRLAMIRLLKLVVVGLILASIAPVYAEARGGGGSKGGSDIRTTPAHQSTRSINSSRSTKNNSSSVQRNCSNSPNSTQCRRASPDPQTGKVMGVGRTEQFAPSSSGAPSGESEIAPPQTPGFGQGSGAAPVGHRQPMAGDGPQDQQQLSDPNKRMKELHDALAKKLQSICRGC
jgi:hypothetical protein